MTYRNAAEVIAQVATPSQSDDPNTTISKSRLLSGSPARWSEELARPMAFSEDQPNTQQDGVAVHGFLLLS
jgi:hypothetical protein